MCDRRSGAGRGRCHPLLLTHPGAYGDFILARSTEEKSRLGQPLAPPGLSEKMHRDEAGPGPVRRPWTHTRGGPAPCPPWERALRLSGGIRRPQRRVCLGRAPPWLPQRPGSTPSTLTSDVFHLALGDRIEIDLHQRPQEVGVGHHALGGFPAELLVPLHDEDALAHRLHLLRGLGEGPAGSGVQVGRGAWPGSRPDASSGKRGPTRSPAWEVAVQGGARGATSPPDLDLHSALGRASPSPPGHHNASPGAPTPEPAASAA